MPYQLGFLAIGATARRLFVMLSASGVAGVGFLEEMVKQQAKPELPLRLF
jgi:hypothetical protein